MKDPRIEKLFAAARQEAPPEGPAVFPQRVISAIRRDAAARHESSILDQLSVLFPPIAWASIIMIGLCVGAELYFSNTTATTSADVTKVAEEWLLASS